MPVQPHPIPETSEAGQATPESAAESAATPAPLWLQRLSLFILVLFCIQLGAILVVVPWWTSVWDRNSLFVSHPQLLAILKLGPVRGIISGFGLLDIWIGISEAVHYRENTGSNPAPRT
jgi:hypothetical protein